MGTFFNFAGFQVIWLGCVLGAAAGWSLLGPCLLLVWLPVHFRYTPVPRADLALALAGLVLGTLIDSAYQVGGLLRFSGVTLFDPLAPLWISSLWIAFLLTVNHSMRWMQGRPLPAGLFGALGGPLSYWAGVRLGAAEAVAGPWMLYGVIAVVWALVMIVLAGAGAPREEPV